jgi:hypothetical protein
VSDQQWANLHKRLTGAKAKFHDAGRFAVPGLNAPRRPGGVPCSFGVGYARWAATVRPTPVRACPNSGCGGHITRRTASLGELPQGLGGCLANAEAD